MTTINEATEAGYVGRDPEDYVSPAGARIVTISLCVTKKSKNPAYPDKPVWFKGKCYKELADRVMLTVKKGDNVMIKGEMEEPQAWIDKTTGKARAANVMTVYQLMKDQHASPPNNASGQSVQPAPAVILEIDPSEIPF